MSRGQCGFGCGNRSCGCGCGMSNCCRGNRCSCRNNCGFRNNCNRGCNNCGNNPLFWLLFLTGGFFF